MTKKTMDKKTQSEAGTMFDQLMANMAETKVFPIDRQPISPMPPPRNKASEDEQR